MKNLLMCSALLSSILLLSGCGSVRSEIHETPDTNRHTGLAKEIQIGDAILTSIREEDYAKFKSNLHEDAGICPAAQDFKTSCANMKKNFGSITGTEFLTELKTPAVQNLIWKITFERKGTDGKKIVQNMLFRLVTGKIDGKLCVLSFGLI